jgi:hypothetical protein
MRGKVVRVRFLFSRVRLVRICAAPYHFGHATVWRAPQTGGKYFFSCLFITKTYKNFPVRIFAVFPMELRHLRYFVGVAEAENVSRAALKLHISQPAVSRQVRDLEDEIGLPLLKRVGKSVRLTEAGLVFLNEARAILARTDEALRNVRALDDRQHTDLHVGYSSWGIDRLFHIVLNTFGCAMPNVHVRLHDAHVEDNVGCSARGQTGACFYLRGAKARRAARPSFSGTKPGAHPSRRVGDAPIRTPACCFNRGGCAPTVHRFGTGAVPRLSLFR